jgi:hypothetical protein
MESQLPSGIERAEIRRSSRPHRLSQKLLEAEAHRDAHRSLFSPEPPLGHRGPQRPSSLTPRSLASRLFTTPNTNRKLGIFNAPTTAANPSLI